LTPLFGLLHFLSEFHEVLKASHSLFTCGQGDGRCRYIRLAAKNPKLANKRIGMITGVRKMKSTSSKTAAQVSREEIFQAIGYAALKARAGHLAPGTVIVIGSFDLVVAEDEAGDGIMVQAIVQKKQIETLALAKLGELDAVVSGWTDQEKSEWMASFFVELREVLRKWQGIEMRQGPGENLTLQKSVSM